MRLVIYGSRSLWPHPTTIDRIVYERWGVLPSLVISGTAYGADRAGEEWAKRRNIPCQRMPASWDQWGKRAGFIRNTAMAEAATAGLGFWDGQSRGTQHMTAELVRLGKPYHVEVLA